MALRQLHKPQPALRPDEVGAMWGRMRTSTIGCVVMATVLWFIHSHFAGIVAPAIFYPWLAFMVAAVSLATTLIVVFYLRRDRMKRVGRGWVHLLKLTTIMFCGGIAASVWVLLPAADNDLRMLMVFLYFWFVAMIMMAGGTWLGVAGCLSLIASLVIFVALHDMPYPVALTGFLVMAGVAIVAIRQLIWRSADDAAAARALSEQAKETLAAALDIVRGERDAKTRFIAAASHDLQQPLQAAGLYFDQVLNEADDARRDGAVRGVRSAIGSTQALLETMLDYLRLEAGAMPARRAAVALDAVVAAVAMQHGPAAAAAGMGLTAVSSRLSAMGDPNLIKRMLDNLVTNAIRHAQGDRILIGARRQGAQVRLWVIDNGNGIAAQDVERLFEEYAQGSNHSPDRGGFGLGLASARHMATLMGGAIGLDQRWTGGSAFHIDLSVGEQHTAGRDAEPTCKAA